MARFQDATRDYGLVFPYRRVEWLLAAIYRQGHLWESLANSYRDAPVPRELRPESEAYYAYLDIVDANVVPVDRGMVLVHIDEARALTGVATATGLALDVRQGDEVSIYYDPMISKLIVSGTCSLPAENVLKTC